VEIWVALAVSGAFLQNLRSALQKSLTGRLAVLGATYARFLFAAPWAVLAAVLLARADPAGAPGLTGGFVLWALMGAGSQIAGQVLLLRLFTLRNFAVGNAFARTETIQAALIGAVLIGDRLALLPALGILASVAGVVVLSAPGGLRGGFDHRAAALGIASGAAFALSGVAYRAASLGLEGEAGFLTRAAVTLAFVVLAQTLAMGIWMRLRAPGAVTAVLRSWRVAALVGVAGMLASLCWFAAFTLASAAEVKAVGQVELIFSMLTARLAFGERPSRRELGGILLVAGGIVLLVLTA
jgi:drug/metabolite transporter (DMT)-like permease